MSFVFLKLLFLLLSSPINTPINFFLYRQTLPVLVDLFFLLMQILRPGSPFIKNKRYQSNWCPQLMEFFFLHIILNFHFQIDHYLCHNCISFFFRFCNQFTYNLLSFGDTWRWYESTKKWKINSRFIYLAGESTYLWPGEKTVIH